MDSGSLYAYKSRDVGVDAPSSQLPLHALYLYPPSLCLLLVELLLSLTSHSSPEQPKLKFFITLQVYRVLTIYQIMCKISRWIQKVIIIVTGNRPQLSLASGYTQGK